LSVFGWLGVLALFRCSVDELLIFFSDELANIDITFGGDVDPVGNISGDGNAGTAGGDLF
jgi:hypothetical protein